jgi:hypothetical protein
MVLDRRWPIFLVCVTLYVVTPIITFSQQKGSSDSPSLKQLEKTDLIDFATQLIRTTRKEDQAKEDGTVHFSVIPIAPTSGNGGVSISAINASFYMAKETNLSSIYFYPYTNFSTSYGILLTPYIWFPRNEWNGTGDFRFVYNGLRDNGLGGGIPPADITVIDHTLIRTYFTGHTRVGNNWYLGAGYDLDYFFGVNERDPSPESPSNFQQYGIGTGPTTVSSGITFNILRDNRKNSVNPTNGYYSAFVIRVNRKAMGSTYDWQSVFFDVRRYFSFSKTRHKILAGRAFYWGTFGDVPYFNLPATFEDPSSRAGRGYQAFRFRGKHWLYSEAEYRFDITSHGFLGGVLFTNLQSYTNVEGHFDHVLPAAGFGFRLKFNRHSDTNVTIDFAYGKEGWNWYLNLGEFF